MMYQYKIKSEHEQEMSEYKILSDYQSN